MRSIKFGNWLVSLVEEPKYKFEAVNTVEDRYKNLVGDGMVLAMLQAAEVYSDILEHGLDNTDIVDIRTFICSDFDTKGEISLYDKKYTILHGNGTQESSLLRYHKDWTLKTEDKLISDFYEHLDSLRDEILKKYPIEIIRTYLSN